MPASDLTTAQLHAEVQARYVPVEEFVDRVNDAIEKYDLTQTDLARVAGYERGNVNRWLRGHQDPPLHVRLVLDEALEVLIKAEGW